ncbi:MAG: FAD-dependent oxidoreductase [Bacilli bacterium]|nr:FAD-dependent oxidoreductase [Bacilli bacterium]MBN2876084.1 FAD-dependent oxidoreductase [Bacilli bacterium]
MKQYDIIVVGSSAAGVPAATTARKYYPEKSILLVRDVEFVPIPCGIPYIYGTVNDPMKNLIPVTKIAGGNKLDLEVAKVTSINREAKTIGTDKGETFGYDRLVLATGSKPIVPPIKGVDKGHVYAIKKNAIYLKEIQEQLDQSKSVVVIGGGFIGAEMAEECKKHNPELEVTVVEMQDHLLKLVYDEEFCLLAEEALISQGIKLALNEQVIEIAGKDNVDSVKLASGKSLPADMVILGIGAVPNTELAVSAGLELGETKGIKVDKYQRTCDPNILACGDCADKFSFFNHKPSYSKLASIATMEARIAGINLFHTRRMNQGVVGCFSTSLGGHAFAAAGITEAGAKDHCCDVVVGTAAGINRHPGLMPGGDDLKVKLIFEKASQRIIGGELYGAYSAGELINAISAFISKGMTAEEIATFQAGTHPALTASPIAYQLVNAAEMAEMQLYNLHS